MILESKPKEPAISGTEKSAESISHPLTRSQHRKKAVYFFSASLFVVFVIASIAMVCFWPKKRVPLTATEVYDRTLEGTALIVTNSGVGSGCLFETSPPRVLTNFHVVEKWDRVIVMFPQRYRDKSIATDLSLYVQKKAIAGISGKIIKRDRSCDLAVIELESLPSDVRALELEDGPAQVGQNAYSIGCSGLDGPLQNASLWRLSTGSVRGRGVRKAPLQDGELHAMILETQSPVNPGDSGGPVVNEYGKLIAIVCGFRPTERLVTWNIDNEEIRKFLGYKPVIASGKTNGAATTTEPEPIDQDKSLETKPSVGQLMVKLKDKNERQKAVELLATYESQAQPAVSTILELMNGSDPTFERGCELALNRIGRVGYLPEKVVLAALASKSAIAQRYAMEWVNQLKPPPPEYLPLLSELIQHPTAGIREKAILTCEAIGPGAKQFAFPRLLQAIGDDDPAVRRVAEHALDSFKPFGTSDLPQFGKSILIGNGITRLYIAKTVVGIVDTPERVDKYILPLLRDSNPEIVSIALTGLTKWVANANRAIVDIQNLLTHDTRSVRSDSLSLLALLPKTASSVNGITRIMRFDPDATMREQAAIKLSDLLGSEKSDLPAISDLLKYGTSKVKKPTFEKVARIGTDALSLLPNVLEALKDSDHDVRMSAVGALVSIKSRTEEVVSLLIELVAKEPASKSDSNAIEFRIAIAKALGKTGNKGLEELIRLSGKSPDAKLFRAVTECLQLIPERPESTIPWLLKCMTEYPEKRNIAASTLTVIGGYDAVSGLIARTEFHAIDGPKDGPHYSNEIRLSAIQALGEMDWQKMDARSRIAIIDRMRFLATKERDGRNLKMAADILRKKQIRIDP